jgi:hypothetical protein
VSCPDPCSSVGWCMHFPECRNSQEWLPTHEAVWSHVCGIADYVIYFGGHTGVYLERAPVTRHVVMHPPTRPNEFQSAIGPEVRRRGPYNH